MYTIVIRIKEDEDIAKIFKNYLAAVKLGIVCRNGDLNDVTRTITHKNLTIKKAVKIVLKIKAIKNFEQIASYTIIKGDGRNIPSHLFT